jgi:C4-dicarboxylate-specific signal transduction histidine kinase
MLELYEIEEYKSTDLYRLWVNSIVDEDKEATAQALQSALDNKAEYNLYFRIKSSAGKIKTIHGTGKVISDKNGNPARMLGANIDVTSIIEKDELLIEQRRIADLSTRLAQLGELSAELGHEINNPLTVCMSSLTLLKLNLKETELNDKTLRNIELLGTGLNRISSLVNNMRNYLHSAGNENSKLIDINDAIKENFELIESLTSKSKATIELELSPSINYECNSTQMSQVLINLMTNAIFAVKETSEKTVRITTYGEDGDIFIRIDDSGTGISPENREQIFEKFFTTKSHNQGTGIGLSLSNEIIQGMGGTLELVDSKLGGASFLITLSKQKRDEFTCNA